MEKENWKVIAIVLATILLLETAAVIGIFKLGFDLVAAKDACENKCALDKECVSFAYDDRTKTCYSYTAEDILGDAK